jgi:hypothetical protein
MNLSIMKKCYCYGVAIVVTKNGSASPEPQLGEFRLQADRSTKIIIPRVSLKHLSAGRITWTGFIALLIIIPRSDES